MPIKVQLRYSPVARTPVLTVVDSTTGVVLSKAVSLPSLDSAHMDIMTEMTAIIRDQCGNDVGVCLDKTIVVNIQSPHLPTLDIVDLPGIVAACSREEIAADVPAKTKHLVEEYIKSHPEAMYLAFLEAGSRFSCAACMEMVQKFNIQVCFLCVHSLINMIAGQILFICLDIAAIKSNVFVIMHCMFIILKSRAKQLVW